MNKVKNYRTGFSPETLFSIEVKLRENDSWVFLVHFLVLCVSTAYDLQTYNITLQHMTHFITQTHHTNRNRDVPNEFCVLRNKSLSRERKQPTFLFTRANMAEEKVAALVVDDGGGMCKGW